MTDSTALTQRHLAGHHGERMVMVLGCPLCAEEMAAQFDVPAESVMRSMLKLRGGVQPDCPHCPDGHSAPMTRPWAVWVGSERDGDGQPTSLRVAPTNGAHVAESDAEWLRQVIRDAKAARCDDATGALLAGQAPPSPCIKPRGHDGAHRNGDGTTWAALGFMEFLQQIPDGDLARFKAAWDAAIARDEAPRALQSEGTDA